MIIQSENPILRAKSQDVKIENISSFEIKKVISDMQEAVRSQKDGVAIAAPQIGVNLNIFLVCDDIIGDVDKEYKKIGRDLIFINPEITKLSREKEMMEEGCLSVRWKYGKVKRSTRITIKGYNEMGESVERGAKGLLAQIFQHEIDHLNGILFTDKALNVEEIPPEIHVK